MSTVQLEPPSSVAADERKSSLGSTVRHTLGRTESVLFLVIIVFGAVVTVIAPNFLSRFNLTTALLGIVTIGVAGLGAAFLLIAGEIDLSIGSIIGLSGTSAAAVMASGVTPVVGVLVGLLVGAGAGLVNGLVVVLTGVNSFVVTLGTQAVFLGVTLQISGGFPIPVPESFMTIGSGTDVVGIPLPIIEMLVLAVICQSLLVRTIWGKRVVAVGDNADAARLAGIPVSGTRLSVFVVGGLFAALAGIIAIASIGSADSNLGQAELLPLIAAVVIGGASLAGGRGSMVGVLLGAALLGLVQNAYVILRLSTLWQQVTFGVVIVVAGVFDQIRQGRFASAGAWVRTFFGRTRRASSSNR